MFDAFREVVVVDTEFIATPGNRPVPVCLVAHELRSGRRVRIWQGQFGPAPPYATGSDVLFVAYYASAEIGCYLVLDWRMPERILDLFCEFRARTNGLDTPAGNSLLGALTYFGLDGMGAAEKDTMRELVLRGGPWSEAERTAILDYCEEDVAARGLIKPPLGHGIAYIDWSQQEFGIAAALSGDAAMQAAYKSGDCYLAFAKQASAVPQDATKATHGPQRELFKQCTLAVQYGMEAQSLALRIAQPPILARELLRAHRETYRQFWAWSDAAVDQAMLVGVISTVFGWPVRTNERSNPRSLRNFPMQANGAEMLRIACCLAVERGIEVCAPIHDAVLICTPLDRLEADIAVMRKAMAESSMLVLAGFELSTEVKVVRWPDRYADPRGQQMWNRVCNLVAAEEPPQQQWSRRA